MCGCKCCGMAVAGLVLAAVLAGCAGTPNPDRITAPVIQQQLDMGSTSRVAVIHHTELSHKGHFSLSDALRLHPAVHITGR